MIDGQIWNEFHRFNPDRYKTERVALLVFHERVVEANTPFRMIRFGKGQAIIVP